MYIVTSGLNPSEDHICHYGVLGMKWGVHRYRDKSGNITKRGKKRFEKVAKDPKLYEKDMHRAKDISFWAIDKAMRSGKPIAAGKAMAVYNKFVDKKIEAGRDFIVQKDLDFRLTGFDNTRKLIINPNSKELAGYQDVFDYGNFGELKGSYYVGDGKEWLKTWLKE